MSKILLVRHGHVEGIAPARFRGREDVPLSALGVRQAQAVAAWIASDWRPVQVYTSPLQRCFQTARAIADACGIELRPLPQLCDLHYGSWQWRTHEEVRARWPGEFARWFAAPESVRFPEGESLQELAARVADALRSILQWHAEETVVLVAHDSSNRALLLQLLDLPLSHYWRLSQAPCGVSEIDLTGDQTLVLRINETHHLRALR